MTEFPQWTWTTWTGSLPSYSWTILSASSQNAQCVCDVFLWQPTPWAQKQCAHWSVLYNATFVSCFSGGFVFGYLTADFTVYTAFLHFLCLWSCLSLSHSRRALQCCLTDGDDPHSLILCIVPLCCRIMAGTGLKQWRTKCLISTGPNNSAFYLRADGKPAPDDVT